MIGSPQRPEADLEGLRLVMRGVLRRAQAARFSGVHHKGGLRLSYETLQELDTALDDMEELVGPKREFKPIPGRPRKAAR